MTAKDFMEEFKNLFPKYINNFRIKPTIKYEIPNWSDGNTTDSRYMIFKCVVSASHCANDKLRQAFGFEQGIDAVRLETDIIHDDFKSYQMDCFKRHIVQLIGDVIVWCNENEVQNECI